MKMIYKLFRGEDFHGKYFPAETIVLQNEVGTEIFCSDFTLHKGKVHVYIHVAGEGKRFIKTEMRNEYTYAMYEYAQKMKKEVDYISKRASIRQMMSHDRKRKNGSGGVRIGKFCGQITDYECRKDPFHDFRRVYN